MITKIFSVWDTKTEAYMQPFFSQTIGSGIRAFSDACTEQSSMLSKHPGDYHLHCLGEFDDATGILTSQNPQACGSGNDYVNNDFEHPEEILKRNVS